MLFGCKLSLAIVSNSVRVRSSDRLPSGGTSVVAVVVAVGLGIDVAADIGVDVEMGGLEPAPFAQAMSPTAKHTLITRRFTPARLCVFGLDY